MYVYGYFVDGLIRLPGSLTKARFDTDPFQVNSRDASRDVRRLTTKGRLGLRYNLWFDEDRADEVDLMFYVTNKYFDRTAGNYRIITRAGYGGTARYISRTLLFGHNNEFTVGTDLLLQAGPVETYQNIGGKKGDRLDFLVDERIGNIGAYFLNTFSIINDRLDLLLSGRYDKVVFDQTDRLLDVRSSVRRFEDFTPKAAVNFKITPRVAVFSSVGLSFDSPAGNELDNPRSTSSSSATLLNPDLKPQKSTTFELGVKGAILCPGSSFFENTHVDLTFFRLKIDDEIVPFEVLSQVFFRNAATTNRTGVELGVTTEIVRGLKLRTAYTLSDFTYDTYVARIVDQDSVGNDVVVDQSFSGNVVPSVPKHNVSLALTYEHKLLDELTGFLKWGYHNVSGMYVDDQNSEKSRGYQTHDASLGLDVAVGRFSLLFSAGVNNIANKTYAAFININSTNGEFYEAGEPRNFFGGLNLGYTF
jgi:iron complex outermembrane receptor protein